MSEFPCAGNPDALWFANPDYAAGREAQRRAAQLCQACPIMAQCAVEALEEGIPHGVWGGMTEWQRWEVWRRQGGRPHGFDMWREFAREGLTERNRAAA